MCWKCLWDVVEGFGSEADGRRLTYKDRHTQINIMWHEAWDKADPIQQFKCYLRGQALQSDEAPGDDVQNSSCPSFQKYFVFGSLLFGMKFREFISIGSLVV